MPCRRAAICTNSRPGGILSDLRLQKLGQEIGDNDPVVLRAELLLRSLRDTLDKSVLLAKVSGLQATYLLAFEPTHPLRFLIKVGEQVRSLHATSGGKVHSGRPRRPGAGRHLQIPDAPAVDRPNHHLQGRVARGHHAWSPSAAGISTRARVSRA